MPIARSKSLRFPAGTTLLEGIIAIGVIITAVVGSLVLIMTTIKLGRANQDRVVAQNLAREGVELAISLRDSASLMRASDASISWDEKLVGYRWNEYSALEYLDIGTDVADFYKTTGSYQFCFQRGAGTACTAANASRCADWDYDGTTPLNGPTPGSGGTGELNRCDFVPLVNNIFAGWEVPPLCSAYWAIYGPAPLGNGTFATNVPCDYTQDGRVDISDLVYMVNTLSSGSYHFTNGYPKISVSRPGGSTQALFGMDMYFSDMKPDPANGRYDITDPAKGLWSDARAQVSSYSGTYVQNPGFVGAQPTKYYRVVSAQEVCRYTDGTTKEVIIPQDNGFDCEKYVTMLHGSAKNISKVGAFVTSEVRWPTPTSSTRAVYQTYIYDWLAL